MRTGFVYSNMVGVEPPGDYMSVPVFVFTLFYFLSEELLPGIPPPRQTCSLVCVFPGPYLSILITNW